MFTNLVIPLLILQKIKFDPTKIHDFVASFHFVVVVFTVEAFFVAMFLFLRQENERRFVVNFAPKPVEQGIAEREGLQQLLAVHVLVDTVIPFT